MITRSQPERRTARHHEPVLAFFAFSPRLRERLAAARQRLADARHGGEWLGSPDGEQEKITGLSVTAILHRGETEQQRG
jgi:hypothetical protein